MDDDLKVKLREHGMQVTAQRLATMRAVAKHPHATADELADHVREMIGAVSRQAVYDTLGALAEKSLVRRIQPAGSAARYEDRTGDNHHHLICRQCGAVGDIDCAVGATPCLTAADSHGFVIDEAEVIYWGRCPQCVQAQPAPPTQKLLAAATKPRRGEDRLPKHDEAGNAHLHDLDQPNSSDR